jgi:hypothetical protein
MKLDKPRMCGTMLLYYAEEVYAVIPKESDRKLLMKYATGKRVWKQDQKRYERLRRIIIDKRREQKEIWNKERSANELLTLLNNVKDAPPEQRLDCLKAISMFLHRDSCEPHTPYLNKTGLNISDLNELDSIYGITKIQQILYKVSSEY